MARRDLRPPPLPMRGHTPAAALVNPPPFTPPLLVPHALQKIHHQGPGEEPTSLGAPLPSFQSGFTSETA